MPATEGVARRWWDQASAGEALPISPSVALGPCERIEFRFGDARAIALANIDPPATVHILGNASVIASALNLGAGSDDETAASANAQLHFTDFTVTVDGNGLSVPMRQLRPGRRERQRNHRFRGREHQSRRRADRHFGLNEGSAPAGLGRMRWQSSRSSTRLSI
jgi:hypothetical protein